MLDGDTTAKFGDTFEVDITYRFGVIKKPVYAIKGNIPVYFLEDIQRMRDGLIVSCM